MEGFLYTKGGDNKSWTKKYFILRNSNLSYIVGKNNTDQKTTENFALHSSCQTSSIERSQLSNPPIYFFSFSIIWSKSSSQNISLSIGTESKEEIHSWKNSVERSIRMSNSKDINNVMDDQQRSSHRDESCGHFPTSMIELTPDEKKWSKLQTNWQVVEYFNGLQIWKQKLSHNDTSQDFPVYVLVMLMACIFGGFGIYAFLMALFSPVFVFFFKSQHLVTSPVLAFKSTKLLKASPSEVFDIIMNVADQSKWDASVEASQIVHTIDKNMDIIHVRYKSVWLWDLVKLYPRDLCLFRYWRKNVDGSYVICYQSAKHPNCGPCPGYERARCVGAGFTIAPKIDKSEFIDEKSSLVSHVVHMDTQGLLRPILQRSGQLYPYMKSQLMALVGLEETIDSCRFVSVDLSNGLTDSPMSIDNLRKLSGKSFISDGPFMNETVDFLPCNVPIEMWCEPVAGTMLVRGPDYKSDKRKIPSAQAAFRLVGVDLFTSEKQIEHICSFPHSIVQKEISRYRQLEKEMPFTFIVNFIVPLRNNYLSMVAYFRALDTTVLSDGSAFAELMMDFLEGSDDFRNERFKLIPCIVEGPFIVRQAVGSTPAIIGKKLRQPYYKGENYFELDIDISSSSVANRVTGLAAYRTRSLVIDMGFLVEGKTVEELPERLFGCIRLIRLDLSVAEEFFKDSSNQ